MATVYLAEDLKHGRLVALKVLRPELAESIGPDRFLQEIRITANLQHPHILALHDSGEADGHLFYVMPYIEGESLKERLAREGELPIADAAQILKDVVDALSAAHAAGVVHRDIKPANVMLSGRHAIVADFGVAKALREAKVEEQLTTVGTSLGTPAYMSPEQAAGDEVIDARADVYAVGALAYEVLAGRPPFTASSHRQLLMAHITQRPDPVTDHRAAVPEGLAGAVMRCLEKRPADRWQRVEELLPYLEEAMASSGNLTPAGMTPARTGRGPGLWLRIGLAATALLASVVGYGLWTGTDAPPVEAPGATSDDAQRVRLSLLAPVTTDADSNFAFVGGALRDEMRRALTRHAPGVPVSFDDREGDAEETQVTHTISTRLSLRGDVLTVNLDVARADGQHLRTLSPISGSADSIPEVLARAADQAAVIGVLLDDARAGERALRFYTLPPTARVAALVTDMRRAQSSRRWSESTELAFRVLELAPDFPGAYLSLFFSLPQVGREAEWPALEARLEAMAGDMTRAEQLVMRVNLTPSLREAFADQAELADLTGGDVALAELGFHAIHVNQLSVAAAALDQVDWDGPHLRDFPFAWKLRADVLHLRGEFGPELDWIRAMEARFGASRALAELEIRALVGLDSVDAALERVGALRDYPIGPHQLWHSVEEAALELRRHGHRSAFADVLDEMTALVNEYPDLDPDVTNDDLDVGQTHYLRGDFEAAIPWFERAMEDPSTEIMGAAMMAIALEAVGRGSEAGAFEQRLLERLASPPPQGGQAERLRWNMSRRVAALPPAARGDVTETIRRLRAAFQANAAYYQSALDGGFLLHLRPEFEAVGNDPAFQNLMAPR